MAASQLSPRSSSSQSVALLHHDDRGNDGGVPVCGSAGSSGAGHGNDIAAAGRSVVGGGNTPMSHSTLGRSALDMPNEAKLRRTVLLFVAASLFVAIAINSGILSVLGLNFHLQSPASYAMALAVMIVLCMSLYCVYCST
jgi:hypothetical protein